MTVAITGENDPPLAADVAASAFEHGPAVQVAASYTDPDVGDSHGFAINTTGTKGKVTDLGSGVFSYDPNGAFASLKAGATATDTFTYTVTDGSNASSTATVTVTITGQNDAPVAADVAASAFEHGPAVQVAASYTDPDVGDNHSFAINTTGTKGKVADLGNGVFSYDPNGAFASLKAGAAATDTFTYTVTDGSDAFSTPTVTVTITGENDPPVAADVAASAFEHGPAVQVAASYTDPDVGDNHSFAINTAGTKGNVTDLGNGVFSYDPNGAFASLKVGATATDMFSYTVTDGSNASSSATVTVTITGENDPPVAADLAASALEHGPAAQVTASYTDPDVGDSHTFAIDAAGTKGKVTDLGNGVFSYNPNGAFASLKAGATATDTFTYTVTDGSNASSTAAVTVTITGQNDAPVAANLAANAFEHGPAVQVTASYTDPDVGDSHGFAINTTGTKGKVIDLGNGVFSYDPNGAFASLKAGATATDTLTYTVTDGSNASSTATVTVTITGENDAPVAANLAANAFEHGPAVQVTASYTDPDVGDSHGFAINTTGTKGKVTNLGNGVFSYDPNGAFASLKAGATATDTFTYTVTDGSNASSTATVTVTITGENDPSVAVDLAASAFEHGPAVQVLASYTDPDVGDSHSFAIDAAGTKGKVTDLGNGVFSYNPNGAFASLKAGATATDTFTYTVTDGSNASSTATVRVTITGQNDAPSAANVVASAFEHGPAVQVAAAYTDPDVGDSHSFAIDTTSTKGKVTDLGSGVFSYDPNGAFASLMAGATAIDTFTYTVTDGSNASSTATVTVTITGQNDPSVAANVSTSVPAQGPAIQVAASYTDPDVGDSHSFAIDTTGTEGKVTDLGNGVFSYDPNGAFASLAAGATATDRFTYTVTDGSNASSTATVTVTVTGVTNTNHPPVAINVTASVSEDGPPVQVAASYTDPDVGDSHSFSVNTTGTKGKVTNLGNGLFGYDPNGAFEYLAGGTTGTDTFGYTVTDGSGASASATVTIRVVGQNDAPTIVGGKFDGSVAEAADDHDGKGKHEASGLVVFADVDLADRHSVTFAPRGSSYIGTFEPTITRDSTGRATGTVGWTYHVSDKALDFLRAGQTILQTYDIAIADGNGGTAKQAITIKLVGANDAPDAHNDVYLLTRGSTVTVSASNGLLANDTDPDAGDTLQISAVNGISAAVGQTIKLESGALLRVNYDGSFTYIPKNDRNEVDSFTYTIVDASGAKSTAKVILAAVKDHDRRDEHDNPSTSSPGSSSAVGFSGMGIVYSVSGNETNWPDAWFTAAVLTGEATNETNIPTARLSQNVSDECTVTIDIGTCITNFELEVEGREYAWRSDLVTSLKTTPMVTANATLRISI